MTYQDNIKHSRVAMEEAISYLQAAIPTMTSGVMLTTVVVSLAFAEKALKLLPAPAENQDGK